MRDGGEDPAAALKALKATEPNSPAFSEMNLNMMGYGLLEAGKIEKAIAVLTWTAEAYPKSANVQDSLAEAFEKAGRAKESRAASEKVLALLVADPALNEQSKEQLRKAAKERIARK